MAKPENINKDSDYIEEEDYSREQKISIKQIILQHIKKISDLSVNEFKEGYTDKKPLALKDGIMQTEKYFPDLRLSYINAIDFLHDLVRPYMDKLFEDNLKKLDTKEEEEAKKIEENKSNEDEWINFLLKLRRRLFAEIILMLHRTNFWDSSDNTVE